MKELGAKNSLLQNGSYENLDNFSYISFDIFKELSDLIFSVHFILPTVTGCLLIDHCSDSSDVFKTKVCWFEPSLAKTKFFSLTLTTL